MHIILSCASITCCNIHICRIVSCLQMRVNKVKFFTDFQLLSHKSVNNQSPSTEFLMVGSHVFFVPSIKALC